MSGADAVMIVALVFTGQTAILWLFPGFLTAMPMRKWPFDTKEQAIGCYRWVIAFLALCTWTVWWIVR